MTREDVVFQGLGEASVCWSETPKGVFDSTKAKEIGETIMALFKDQDEAVNHLSALVENKNTYIETVERQNKELEEKYNSLIGQ